LRIENLAPLTGLDPASDESFRVTIHEMDVAALYAAAQQNAVSILYEFVFFRPFHHGI